MHRQLNGLLIAAGLFLAGMLAAYAFCHLGLQPESTFLLFIICVMIAVIETGGALWGLALGVAFVFAYNYFFTEPLYTFMITDPNYYITCVIFIIVAIIVNTLTSRLQKQVDIAERNERIMMRLYKISTGLLNSSSSEEACRYAGKELSRALGREVRMRLGDPGAQDVAAARCYAVGMPTGNGEVDFPHDPEKNLPLKTKRRVYGVASVDCGVNPVDAADRRFIDAVVSQTVVVIERDDLESSARDSMIDVEHEKLKTNLLRSVSHDLRTPLTSIASGAEFLLANIDSAEKETISSVLESIDADAEWLSEMVDNLLSMTRVQDADVPIEKKNEVVDDVISAAVTKEAKRKGAHEIVVNTPEEVMLVPMDGRLIVQVLINLIDNALKHTREDSTITVSAERQLGNMVFSVADDGGGIDPLELDKIFDSFYSGGGSSFDRQKGMGLGLSICKSIVEAHGGWISATNNDAGGATFSFALPMGDGTHAA